MLNSDRAVEINIQIMQAFVRLREMILSNKDLARKLDALECKWKATTHIFDLLFEAVRQLMTPPEPKKRKIGSSRANELHATAEINRRHFILMF